MILSCNSCQKKFVVPDNAITSSGRLVQCSSCGNKWKQYPIITSSSTVKKNKNIQIKPLEAKIQATKKVKKNKFKKKNKNNLYTPDYLMKKHGITLKDKPDLNERKDTSKEGFGFYSSLLVLIVISIFILRLIFFFQDLIIKKFPFTENYIYYLFESIRNIKVIIENFLLQ